MELAAKRFMLTFGGREQNVNMLHVILFALLGCNLFQYATAGAPGGAMQGAVMPEGRALPAPGRRRELREGLLAKERPLLETMATRQATRLATRLAMRNAFAFGMTGLMASLVASDQALPVVFALTWGAIGWALTLRCRWLGIAVGAAAMVLVVAMILRTWQERWSGWLPALVLTAFAVVTGYAVWSRPASGSPVLLLLGACVFVFLYLIFLSVDIAKGAALAASANDLSLTDFVRKLKTELDPKTRALLNAGLEDGRLGDDPITVSRRRVRAGDLLPTQTQIDLDKSVGFYLGTNPDDTDLVALVKSNLSGESRESTAPAITVATANGKMYVIDGHHRWSQQLIFGGANTLLACDVIEAADRGIDDPVKVLKIVQLAIAASIGKVPAATVNTAHDVFAMNEGSIRAYYQAPVSGSSPRKSWVVSYAKLAEIVPGGDAVQWLVSQTVPVIATKQALGDLPREAMPQLDVGTSPEHKLRRLSAGHINWAAPF